MNLGKWQWIIVSLIMYDSNCRYFSFHGLLLEQISTALDIEYGVINLTNAFFLFNFQQMEDTRSNFLSLDGTNVHLYDFLRDILILLTKISLFLLCLERVIN